ncbi:MAG TPA: DMT family transporter [Gemmatimonadales bacterium]|nr:DMT family transporter [Gemmatimonadales bacterium]
MRAAPLLTTTALVAFAANSLLCRVALRSGSIDAASFSTVRIATGAAMLLLLVGLRRAPAKPRWPGSWVSAAALFLYAVPFSFAYLRLGAATGALLLFGAVQITMVLAAVLRGQRPRPMQWAGLGAAFGGLIYLFLPGLSAPAPLSAALMLAAGIAWGVYSLRGHGTADALAETAGNFARAVPLVLLLALATLPALHARPSGIAWAALSGAVASGLGYAVWYQALRALTSVTAAVVQLAVPVLAGIGGVALLGEQLTLRLAAAAVLVLGGIGMTILGRARAA